MYTCLTLLIILFGFSYQQDLLISGEEYYNAFANQTSTTEVPILSNNTTVTNIISMTTVVNSTQSCLTAWQKIQLLFNFASFDVNQYLNCLTNNAGSLRNKNYLLIVPSLVIYFTR